MLVAGIRKNIVYAKVDPKLFKAVNTAKGPWPLVDALDHIRNDGYFRRMHTHATPHISSEALLNTHLKYSLGQVSGVIRKIAIDLIGPDNFEGASRS